MFRPSERPNPTLTPAPPSFTLDIVAANMEEEGLVLEPFSDHLPPQSPIGSVMNTLLSSRCRHLEAAISRVGIAPSKSSSGALLDESLCFLWRQVEEAVKTKESLDEVLLPIIQHLLMFARHKKSTPSIVLLRWLISNGVLSHALLSRLVEILRKKNDHYVALGWCILVGKLIEDILVQSFEKSEIKDKSAMLKALCQSIPDLTSIICTGSKQSGGFELPTRLSIAAADCVLILTEALAKWTTVPECKDTEERTTGLRINKYQLDSICNNKCEEKNSHQSCHQILTNMNAGEALWGQLDCLIIIVQKLQAWSKKSQPLHARGLEQVWKWLNEMKVYHSQLIPSTGNNLLRDGILLLCSCWKQYTSLLRFDASRFAQNHKELLMQFMSAIQFYTKKPTNDSENSDTTSNAKTRMFFLNCIALLWGRLQGKYLESALTEYGHELLSLLFNELRCNDEYLIEGAVSILKSIVFVNSSSHAGTCVDISRMESLLPLLLDLLDERDSTSPAILQLAAECCYVYPQEPGIEELLRRLKDGNCQQKKNAIGIILELVRLDSANALPAALRANISKCMLDCLADKELAQWIEVTELFPHLDYSVIFPALVHLVYSEEEKVSSIASKVLIVMLQCQSDNFDVLSRILDSLSNLSKMPSQVSSPGVATSKGSTALPMECKGDIDCIFRLILRQGTIQNWRPFVEKLIQKMFAEPSNAVIVRFMSHISEHLAENIDLVSSSLLSYFKSQPDLGRSLLNNPDASSTTKDILETEDALFSRLCPLLLMRVLPLKVFDDLQAHEMYGDLDMGGKSHCIASYLVKRAFNLLEYADVRKLAAELCGRIHPQILYPLVVDRLNHAMDIQDILPIKACLFIICTSLVARGSNHSVQKEMAQIRNAIDVVLSWYSLDSSDVAKAQHGCIDCLALMICNEMQTLPTSNHGSVVSDKKKDSRTVNIVFDGRNSVLVNVIQKLTCDKINQKLYKTVPLRIRLCMANVLISACQKLPDSKKGEFACMTIPTLLSGLQDIVELEVRTACLQVLFSAVYHLKSAVLSFASDLLRLMITVLKSGSEKEKLAAAKLMGTLMASEEDIVLAISSGLLEAKAVLVHNASLAAAPELRELCQKLLSCITSP